ncbi:MAG TPA: ABC transporter permease [Longimicrobiaceae bacterium]|nr:ABC transporter permease [Longimicrobiaceae bacterium]
MEWITRWRKRLRVLIRREEVERELEEEFAFHLEMETRNNIRAGMTPEAARRQAVLTFGGRERFREEVRDARWFAPVIELTPDVKLALRMLAKHPVLSVTGALGMAVGVAIATGFFSFMAFYYSAPPLDEGDRIVGLDYLDMSNEDCFCTTLFDLDTWRGSQRSVRQLSAFRDSDRYLRVPGGTTGDVRVAEMTASGFDVARVPPLLGRPLLESDEAEGAPAVLVIGHDEWRRNFGADRGIVGREVRLDGTPYTVVGVMPEGFRFPHNHGYWTALRSDPALHRPGEGPRVTIFGRLVPGVPRAAAEAELRTVSARLAREFPAAYATLRPIVRPYVRVLLDVHQYPAWIVWTMQLFAALVLAAVAVTVASLIYARTASRQAEIAVRTALGASRRRIITQLFVEALALSSLAAVTGLLIANVAFRQIVAMNPGSLPYWIEPGLPASTVAYAMGLAVLAAFIVGIVPALAATGQRLQSTLRQMGGATGMQLGSTWTALIVVQVAVAVAVLPPVIGIAWNSYRESRAEPTFPVEEMLVLRLERDEAPAREALAAPSVEQAGESFAETQAELIRRIAAEPGVLGVTYASAPPRSGQRVRIEVEGGVTTADAAPVVALSSGVAPNYFDVFGAQVLAGRPFGSGDAPGGAAAVVSRSFVRRFLGGGVALGRRVRSTAIAAGDSVQPGLWLEIVGVVDDLYDQSGEPELQRPAIYLPTALGAAPVTVAIRTRGIDPDALVPRLWEIAGEVTPGRPMTVAGPDELRGGDTSRVVRFSVILVGLVTLSVLLLSAVGISAMMSFAVTRRYREIGIRLALGASRRQVLRTIFSRAALQLALGLAVGVVLVTLVERLGGDEMMRGQHHVLVPMVAALVLAAGLLATAGPARQALRVHPMEALRQE